jgi:hypothetical protein
MRNDTTSVMVRNGIAAFTLPAPSLFLLIRRENNPKLVIRITRSQIAPQTYRVGLTGFEVFRRLLDPSKSGLMNKHIVKTYRVL